ncbi:MAG: (d)CMP kinase [Clostridia bacterium]|jgi:cytidylate kinase|nr:(d)CMP kinase [Clostridia bacterium]
MSFIVAIDGPAGTGKGTIAKLVSEKFGLLNVDTGAMFRCVTLAMLQQNIALEEEEKIQALLSDIQIELKEENGELEVFLNGEDVTSKIRTPEVNAFISGVSSLKIVRSKLLELQRNLAKGQNVVMEGRDIGTTVFPNANVKIYLDASSEERARRRVRQNEEKGIHMSYEEVLESVKKRDKLDSTRELAPLKKAEDAIYIDGTNMSVEECANVVYKIIEEKMKNRLED